MPKRGGGGGRGGRWSDGDRPASSYNDNSVRRPRKVSFKPTSNSRWRKNPDKWGDALMNLNADDVDMNDHVGGGDKIPGSFRGGFRGRGGRKDGRVNSPAPRQHFQPRNLLRGPSPWYRVTIPYGQKHDKSFLLKALLTNLAPDVFVPHYYGTFGNAAVFYVDDYEMAEKLINADRKITMPDGFKLSIRVKNGTPIVTVNEAVLEKMKLAMASRYNAENKALNLSKFHTDPALADIFCPLFRPTIMLAILNVISENIPDLIALNLNDNKLQSIDQNISKKLPHLKILYLANNRIPHISAMENLKSLSLIELFLEGNPLADRFKDKDLYVREVRKRCTKLVKLDGANLPPLIGFDVPDEVSIPTTKQSFLCNADGQMIVRQFLEQYFALYDSDSRQPLLDAYHESAILSLCANSYSYGPNQNTPSHRMNNYMQSSRNLLKLQDRDYRRRHLKCGRLQVVSFLNDLPKTQHNPHSFSVDLTVFVPTMLMLTVSGVFREVQSDQNSQNRPSVLRSFHKTMIIVPQGAGFCIQNDIVTVTNVTPTQEKDFSKGIPEPVSQPAADPVVYNPAVPPPQTTQVPVVAPPNVTVPTPEMKQQLVQTVAMQTNMNLEWSANCLEQTHWDLSRAMLVFTELHKQGKIPPEAFIK